ncbi:hypothetical protein, partial [Aquidulcibacter sp.]|uniref:hypothetical protein n=1 Tax=Aquidulcibacter sp. TaxID=2052990 RepID=UPI003BA5C9B4
SLECTKVTLNLGVFLTWNAFKPRSAHLEAARQLSLRQMGSQGVQSATPTREARPLTPHLARSNSTKAFA